MTFKSFKAKNFENRSLFFLEVSQSREFPGLLEWKIYLQALICCVTPNRCPCPEGSSSEKLQKQRSFLISRAQRGCWCSKARGGRSSLGPEPLAVSAGTRGHLWRRWGAAGQTVSVGLGSCSACDCEMSFNISAAANPHVTLVSPSSHGSDASSSFTSDSSKWGSSNRSCF